MKIRNKIYTLLKPFEDITAGSKIQVVDIFFYKNRLIAKVKVHAKKAIYKIPFEYIRKLNDFQKYFITNIKNIEFKKTLNNKVYFKTQEYIDFFRI